MWGEWDSEAARGMWWGCIMAGVVSKDYVGEDSGVVI